MDFIEGIPTSNGVNVIFVVIDRLRNLLILSSLNIFTATDAAQTFVLEIVRLHAFPRSIVSDRDSLF